MTNKGLYILIPPSSFLLPPSSLTPKSTGLDPDVTMMGVARHKAKFFSHSLFYEQAAAGKLPAFSWISPAHEAADHPCLDIAKGERLLKDVYEVHKEEEGRRNKYL